MEITVREATSDDRERIVDLYLELRDHHAVLQPGNPRYSVPREGWERTIDRTMVSDNSRVVVAEAAGGVVGFLRLAFVEKPWGVSCEVQTLVIDAAHRNQGVGHRLMEAAEKIAREENAAGLRVDVLFENDRAREFYERLGYERTSIRLGKPVEPNP